MEPKSRLALAITAILSSAVLNSAFDEQTPACILAIPIKATVGLACHDKQLVASLHLERKDGTVTLRLPSAVDVAITPAVGAANAIRQIMATAGQFPAAYEETFAQPWRGNLLITTPTAGPAPIEPPEPPHHDDPLLALESPMPVADAWPHFDDEGYDDDSVELAA
jgi:hypothetical protein